MSWNTAKAGNLKEALEMQKEQEAIKNKKFMLNRAKEWWYGLKTDQQNMYFDMWILKAYKDLTED